MLCYFFNRLWNRTDQKCGTGKCVCVSNCSRSDRPTWDDQKISEMEDMWIGGSKGGKYTCWVSFCWVSYATDPYFLRTFLPSMCSLHESLVTSWCPCILWCPSNPCRRPAVSTMWERSVGHDRCSRPVSGMGSVQSITEPPDACPATFMPSCSIHVVMPLSIFFFASSHVMRILSI